MSPERCAAPPEEHRCNDSDCWECSHTPAPLADGGEYPDAYCLAHSHGSRELEAICSLRFQITALRARVAELERVIEEAPHGQLCRDGEYVNANSSIQHYCDCFKSKAKVGR